MIDLHAALPWLIVGLIVTYVARVFILKACCAVADVKEPDYIFAALWALIVLTLVVGAAFFLQWLFSKLDTDPEVLLAPMRITGLLISLVLSWALGGLLYWLVLNTTPFKGFWVAALELLLTILVGVLLGCIALVSLAVYQLTGFSLLWQCAIALPVLLLLIAGLVYWYVIRPKLRDRAEAAAGIRAADVRA